MRVKTRLAATAIALLLPTLALGRWLVVVDAPTEAMLLPTLPAEIGAWTLSVDRLMDENEMALLSPDAHLVRRYEAPGRASIWAYVGMYAGREAYARGAHDPAVCYPAQGWEIVDSRSAEIRLAKDETLRVKLLDSQYGLSRQAVLYWFQPAQRWPVSEAAEQLVRILDAVAGRPQYAFVRLSARSDTVPDAARDLAEFAEQVAWPIRDAVSGVDPGPTAQVSDAGAALAQ